MKPAFRLPSQGLDYRTHDCRVESLKYKFADRRYDAHVLTKRMTETRQSVNQFYDSYLTSSPGLRESRDDEVSAEETKSPSKVNLEERVKETGDKRNLDQTPDYDDFAALADSYILETQMPKSQDIEEFMEKKDNNRSVKEGYINSDNKSYGNVEWPSSIACTLKGDVLVVDKRKHRILIFNSDFIFKYQLGGSQGSWASEFDEPNDIVLSQIGLLYVADTNNRRLQIFEEKKIFKKASMANLFGDKAKATSRQLIQQPPMFKSGVEFKYEESLNLDDKPLWLSSSPLSSVLAISTEKGHIFILNESNQIIAYLNLKRPFDSLDLRNICLNETGSELISLKRVQGGEYLIKIYPISLLSTEEAPYSRRKSSFDSLEKPLYHKEMYKLKLDRKFQLERDYSDSICLADIKLVRLGLDPNFLIIYDSLNLNLLEFDMTGKFHRIVLKAENHLANLVAFDFSSDREHLVCCDFEVNRNYKFTYSSNGFTNNYKFIDSINAAMSEMMSRSETPHEFKPPSKAELLKRSRALGNALKTKSHIFKLKTLRL